MTTKADIMFHVSRGSVKVSISTVEEVFGRMIGPLVYGSVLEDEGIKIVACTKTHVVLEQVNEFDNTLP